MVYPAVVYQYSCAVIGSRVIAVDEILAASRAHVAIRLQQTAPFPLPTTTTLQRKRPLFFLTVDIFGTCDSSPAYLASWKDFKEMESRLFVNRGTRYTRRTLLPGSKRERQPSRKQLPWIDGRD